MSKSDAKTFVDDPGHRGLDRKQLVQAAFLASLGGSVLGSLARAPHARAARLSPAAATDTLRFAAIGPVTNLDLDNPVGGYFPQGQIHTGTYDNLTDMHILPALSAAEREGRRNGFPAVPNLAASWELSKNRTIYRFHLRKGVKSNYGNEFNADDVTWSVGKSIAAKSVGGFFYGLAGLKSPQDVRAIDANTVEFKLAAPSPYFLQLLACWWLAPQDATEVQKHVTAKDKLGQRWLATHTAGFGPYTITSFTPRQITLEKRTDYWRAHPGRAKAVQIATEESSTRLQLLLTGSVDAADELSPLQLDSVAKSSRAKVMRFTSSVSTYLVLNTARPPLNDPKIRQAIARAIPYEQILTSVYRGRAQRWRTLLPPFFLGATDAYWRYETDPAAAKAGLAPLAGQSIKLSYRTGRGAQEQIAILVQKALDDAGLKVELNGMTSQVYDTEKFKHVLDFFIAEETPVIPSSLYTFQLFFQYPEGLVDMAQYDNPAFKKIVKQLDTATRAGAGTAQQVALIRQGQKILLNDLPGIPLAFTANSAAIAQGLTIDTIHNPGGNLSWAQLKEA